MTTKCFLLEPTDQEQVTLRRYDVSEDRGGCPGAWGYHRAIAIVVPQQPKSGEASGDNWPHDDPRWPAKCQDCDYLFVDTDAWQCNRNPLFSRSDTGELVGLMDAPAGALWYADWLTTERYKGPDGRTLCARTPGGDWIIDSVASNCTLRDDESHRCWMRHGTPPNVTVNKEPEPPFDHTCSAGAGSIQAGAYHGFLTNGEFTDG